MERSEGENGRNGQGRLPLASARTSLDRLSRALLLLDQAVEARIEREADLVDVEAEVQRMGADRARLAEALDGAEARAQRLESTNREVSRRLVDAMETIRSVLDNSNPGN